MTAQPALTGLRLRVRLTPRARGDRIEGWAEDAEGRPVLRVRVSAPPIEGAANAALARLLARALGVPKSAIRIAAGETSRAKTLEIAGDPVALSQRLTEF